MVFKSKNQKADQNENVKKYRPNTSIYIKAKRMRGTQQYSALEMIRKELKLKSNKGKRFNINQWLGKIDRSFTWFHDNIGHIRLAREWLQINPSVTGEVRDHYISLLIENDISPDVPESLPPAVPPKLPAPERQPPMEFFPQENLKKEIQASASKRRAEAKEEVIGEKPLPIDAANFSPVYPASTRADDNKRSLAVEKAIVEAQRSQQTEVQVLSKKGELLSSKHDDPHWETLEKIKKEYVFARPGVYPAITKIMETFGLLGKDGKELTNLPLEHVLEIAEIEQWRVQRQSFIARINDYCEEERIVADRTIMQKMKGAIENTFNIIHTFNMQFAKKGRVNSLDESKIIDWKLDTSSLIGLAEAYRRLSEGVAPLVQTNIINGHISGSMPIMSGAFKESPMLGAYVKKLSEMSLTDLDNESKRISNLMEALNSYDENSESNYLKEIEKEDEKE